MDLSIIIVNWNTKQLLRECLYSIKQNSNNQEIRLIVVDNASNDSSREMVQTLFPDVHLINSKANIGFARANNLGLSYADTSFILFLNPDTLVMPDTLTNMIEFMKNHPSVGVTSCKRKNVKGGIQTIGLQWFPSPFTELLSIFFLSEETLQRFRGYLPIKDPNKSDYVSVLYGTCLMMRKEVLEKVGHFDERFFMYSEDVDLSWRINGHGWKLYYLSEAEIIHHGGGASIKAGNHFSTIMKCESRAKLMHKYYGNRGRLLYELIIFMGSNFRLIILVILKLISPIYLVDRDNRYRESISKYIAMLKWSLHIQRPK